MTVMIEPKRCKKCGKIYTPIINSDKCPHDRIMTNNKDEGEMTDKLVEKCLLTDEELAEDAEMIYNFHMDISGIKNLLWQECRKQIKQAIPIIRKAIAEEIKRELEAYSKYSGECFGIRWISEDWWRTFWERY